jgi:trans-aconitate methyltransferase
MTHDEMVALIRDGVLRVPNPVWADFGAGSGNFTRALRQLLGPQAVIYALDQDAHALRSQRDAIPVHADFTQPLELPLLDGILMANALHWLRDQSLQRFAAYLRPGGRFLLVEYDVETPRGYVPHPVPYARFETLARAAGFNHVRHVANRVSPSGGADMYAAVALK